MDDARAHARRLVGALLVCGYPGAGAPPEAFLRRVRHGRMGGVILFARNVPTLASALEARRALDDAGGRDVPVAIDEEGGWVSRLPAPWPRLPAAMALAAAAADRPDEIRAYARSLAGALRALGFTQDYAPVLDVNTAPDNPVIGSRAFGDEPERVARLGAAFAAGLEDGDVIATGKHFPGHGATHVDSHVALPVLDFDLERLERVELVPFVRAARAGMSAWMTAHVALPQVAEAPGMPATVSRVVLTDIARRRLGFDGLIVTDCMEMQGVARAYGTARAAVTAPA
jgi:beta-N-acetylhexosaminidase